MSDSKLIVKTFVLGAWQTNCHVVHLRDGAECWIVDAGFEPGDLIDYIKKKNLSPSKLVLTHAHVDHIAGIDEVREFYPDLPILIHEAEKDFLTDHYLNLSIALAAPISAPPADELLQHGQTLSLGDVDFEVRHTPGHSPGGITLYHAESNLAIVGDTLFSGSVGRSDFPTSDQAQLFASIQEQLYTLPDETRALPGHGPNTKIGHEKLTNPFVRAE